MYSAITSAIGAQGATHGGANEGVIKMLQEIGSVDKVDAFVEDCLKNKVKIMGIGHRVYKVLDPRAPHLKAMAEKLSGELGETKWLDMSERIRDLMVSKKNLHPNVDFYSATVYYSLGIPTDLFTPLFAIARLGLDGARAGAIGRQPPHPSEESLRWAGRLEIRPGRSSLSQALGQATRNAQLRVFLLY